MANPILTQKKKYSKKSSGAIDPLLIPKLDTLYGIFLLLSHRARESKTPFKDDRVFSSKKSRLLWKGTKEESKKHLPKEKQRKIKIKGDKYYETLSPKFSSKLKAKGKKEIFNALFLIFR